MSCRPSRPRLAGVRPVAAASPGPLPTSWRKTSSSVGRTRSKRASRTPGGHDERQRLGRRPARVSETVTRMIPWSSADVARPGGRAEARQQPGHRGVLARLRVQLQDRPGVPGEQLVDRRLGDQAPVVEDGDPVADPLDVGEDVRAHEDGGRAAQPADELQDVAPALGIERAHRLVEEEDRGTRQHRLAHAESLAHPARVPADAATRRLRSVPRSRGLRRPARGGRRPPSRRHGPRT